MLKPKDFSYLRGTLTGISDRMLSQHLGLYKSYVDQFNAIQATYPLTDWTSPGNTQKVEKDFSQILDARVSDLDLVPDGVLADMIDKVMGEMSTAGIELKPNLYLGDGDWWTSNLSISINMPWYLANPVLWRLAARQEETTYTVEQVARLLRHEIGHAVNYAYELYKRPDWNEVFGDFYMPYREDYTALLGSKDFVNYSAGMLPYYAQKHPDEDWAETFGVWLDPGSDWRNQYAEWPGALKKLEYLDALWNSGVLAGAPKSTYLGKPNPYKRIKLKVRDVLGAGTGANPFNGVPGWSEHSELLRREPNAYNGIVLHELYFENMGMADPLMVPERYMLEVTKAWGSWDSYLLDLRAIAGSTTGWALTVWDYRLGRLRNALVEGHTQGVPADCRVVLALDTWEHAYAADYGTRKDVYLGAFFRNVNWDVAESRMKAAHGQDLAELHKMADALAAWPVGY